MTRQEPVEKAGSFLKERTVLRTGKRAGVIAEGRLQKKTAEKRLVLTNYVHIDILNEINDRRLIKYEKSFISWEFHK